MNSRVHDVFRIKIEQKLQSLHKQKYPVKIVGTQQNVVGDLKDMEEGQTQCVTQRQLLDIINVVMVAHIEAYKYLSTVCAQFQQHLIELGNHINHNTRLQLLFILFQAALIIVINAYNLATFLINSALQTDNRPLSTAMLFFFHGFHILRSALQVLWTVFAFTTVYNSILNAAVLGMQLDLYASDVVLRSRLMEFVMFINTNLRKYSIFGLYNLDGSLIVAVASGTVTYIIVLIQYGDNDKILGGEGQPLNLSTNRTY